MGLLARHIPWFRSFGWLLQIQSRRWPWHNRCWYQWTLKRDRSGECEDLECYCQARTAVPWCHKAPRPPAAEPAVSSAPAVSVVSLELSDIPHENSEYNYLPGFESRYVERQVFLWIFQYRKTRLAGTYSMRYLLMTYYLSAWPKTHFWSPFSYTSLLYFTDGDARIFSTIPLFYLSRKKSTVPRVTPSHWERESAHGGGTREDGSHSRLWDRRVLYPSCYAPRTVQRH